MQKISKLFNNKKETPKAHKRSYRAAKTTNSNFSWKTHQETEDSAIHKSLQALRTRSRGLARDNPIMKHFLLMLGQSVPTKH